MDWESVDLEALARLREIFLSGAAEESGPYWEDEGMLASYDFTFGRRIAWKWSAVLEPLLARGWTVPESARVLVDWGCGTAIGARSVLAHARDRAENNSEGESPARPFDEVLLWDRSPAATRFAEAAVRERHPDLDVRVVEPSGAVTDRAFVLVVSHVLGELAPTDREELVALAARAVAVLWVEPGTFDASRALIDVREQLRGEFHCWSPCTHDARCGMLALENGRHWCHHFARPPTEAFTDPGWAGFSRALGIDLRSLPHSHLVLDRRPAPREPSRSVRLIGEPRRSSNVLKLLRCRADGVAEVELVKRRAPALWRALDKGRHDGLFGWDEPGGGRPSGGGSAEPAR